MKKNFENGSGDPIAEKRREREEEARRIIIEKAYQKALKTLNEDRISPENFVHYDQEMVRADMEYVERVKNEIKLRETPESVEVDKYAFILEVIINEQIELSEWLGQDTRTRKASDFDDLKNKVDSIATFQDGVGTAHMALALDVTYSRYLEKKFQSIRTEIDRGSLAEVKYFESPDETFQGILRKVPRVIVGSTKRAVAELAEMWLDSKRKKELARHPFQLEILNQISCQLSSFRDYAERIGKNDLAKIYQRQLNIIEQIKSEEGKTLLYNEPRNQRYRRNELDLKEIEKELEKFR